MARQYQTEEGYVNEETARQWQSAGPYVNDSTAGGGGSTYNESGSGGTAYINRTDALQRCLVHNRASVGSQIH